MVAETNLVIIEGCFDLAAVWAHFILVQSDLLWHPAGSGWPSVRINGRGLDTTSRIVVRSDMMKSEAITAPMIVPVKVVTHPH